MYESKYILAATQTCAAAEQRVLALDFFFFFFWKTLTLYPERETLCLVEESGNTNGISGMERNN